MLVDIHFSAPELEEPPPSLPPNVRKLRIWGDPVMLTYGFDISLNTYTSSNWQNLKLWNPATGWGAIANFLHIDRAWIDYLKLIQVPDTTYPQGIPIYHSKESKMGWLCSDKGKMYFDALEWETLPSIKWGTTAVGGNYVTIEDIQTMTIPDPSDGTRRRTLEMARLKCFRKFDWARPLSDMLAEGIVHRCYCVYRNNGFGDTPKGIIYSPLWSPLDWDFGGSQQPDCFWLPTDWML